MEKRSIAGAELMVPPIVETGEESVVTALGFFWSSFRRCSFNNENEDQKHRGQAFCFNLGVQRDEKYVERERRWRPKAKTEAGMLGLHRIHVRPLNHRNAQQLRICNRCFVCAFDLIMRYRKYWPNDMTSLNFKENVLLVLLGEPALLPGPPVFPSRPLW